MKYKITKNLMGAWTVKFSCPKCKVKLSEALKYSGRTDTCPECGKEFTIPGTVEREELRQRELQKKFAAEQAREEEERARREQEAEAVAAEYREKEREAQAYASARREAEMISNARKEKLAGYSFNVNDHVWSEGGPYVYTCYEMGEVSQNWPDTLSRILQKYAGEGWEYYRSESLVAQRPNGCLAGLLGNPTSEFSVTVLVFRKPAGFVKLQKQVDADIPLPS